MSETHWGSHAVSGRFTYLGVITVHRPFTTLYPTQFSPPNPALFSTGKRRIHSGSTCSTYLAGTLFLQPSNMSSSKYHGRVSEENLLDISIQIYLTKCCSSGKVTPQLKLYEIKSCICFTTSGLCRRAGALSAYAYCLVGTWSAYAYCLVGKWYATICKKRI